MTTWPQCFVGVLDGLFDPILEWVHFTWHLVNLAHMLAFLNEVLYNICKLRTTLIIADMIGFLYNYLYLPRIRQIIELKLSLILNFPFCFAIVDNYTKLHREKAWTNQSDNLISLIYLKYSSTLKICFIFHFNNNSYYTSCLKHLLLNQQLLVLRLLCVDKFNFDIKSCIHFKNIWK